MAELFKADLAVTMAFTWSFWSRYERFVTPPVLAIFAVTALGWIWNQAD